jgi:hypothetical protein
MNKPAVAARSFFGLCVNDGLSFYADRFVRVVRRVAQMPALPRKLRLSTQQRLALQLLACAPFGATETAPSVDGFTRRTLVRPIRTDLQQHSAILRLAVKLSAASAHGGRSTGARRLLSADRRWLTLLPRLRAPAKGRLGSTMTPSLLAYGPAASRMEEPT